MLSAYLVYNPAAGRYPSWLLTERAAHILENEGWDIHIETTQNGEHLTQLAYQSAAEKVDAFIVVGGDGSINRALPGLIGTQTALGVLPAGTANVWARELGLPGLSWTRWMALEESSRQIARPRFYDIDVGECNQVPFLLWSGIGLDAFIVHRIEPRSRWEKHFAVVQYATSAVWNASQWGGINLKVITEDHQINGHFLLAVVSNIHLYAGGLATLSPDALLNDGMMDLWLFEGRTLGDTVQRAIDLWAGRHVQSENVQRITFNKIVLEAESPMYTQIDGEPGQVASKVTINVIPRALRILVPESAPLTLFSQQFDP